MKNAAPLKSRRQDTGSGLTTLDVPKPVYRNMGDVGSRALFIWRAVLFLILLIVCVPVQLVLMALRLSFQATFVKWFHRMLLKILGVQVVRKGTPHKGGPTLFISNHISYLDIPLLGAEVEGSFVAKAEISGWPMFGWLAKLQRSIFIDREPKNAATHAAALKQRLESGENLFLFPEGTTSDGVKVQGFKSSLFSVAQIRPDDKPLAVQPVSLSFTHLDDMPMGRHFRFFFSWFGDQDLAPHLIEALQLGKVTVEIEFHPVVTFDEFGKRQLLAKHCHEQVSNAMSDAIAGRSLASD